VRSEVESCAVLTKRLSVVYWCSYSGGGADTEDVDCCR